LETRVIPGPSRTYLCEIVPGKQAFDFLGEEIAGSFYESVPVSRYRGKLCLKNLADERDGGSLTYPTN
jgi:hypothetical protein